MTFKNSPYNAKSDAFLPNIPKKWKKSVLNKTSIQWTPGSQNYLSSKKIILGQKMIFEQKKSKQDKYTMDPEASLSQQKEKLFGQK